MQEDVFQTYWCFIIDILEEDFLKLFPVIDLVIVQKQHKFSHIYLSLIFMSSALLWYVVVKKLQLIIL